MGKLRQECECEDDWFVCMCAFVEGAEAESAEKGSGGRIRVMIEGMSGWE